MLLTRRQHGDDAHPAGIAQHGKHVRQLSGGGFVQGKWFTGAVGCHGLYLSTCSSIKSLTEVALGVKQF